MTEIPTTGLVNSSSGKFNLTYKTNIESRGLFNLELERNGPKFLAWVASSARRSGSNLSPEQNFKFLSPEQNFKFFSPSYAFYFCKHLTQGFIVFVCTDRILFQLEWPVLDYDQITCIYFSTFSCEGRFIGTCEHHYNITLFFLIVWSPHFTKVPQHFQPVRL